jgi:hypothetical protein
LSVDQQPSNIFPLLFAGLGEESNVTIFDAGLAVPETVDFFSQYRCQLHFTDLYSEPVVRETQHEALEEELLAEFLALLDFPEGTRFDICLFWDFFNYLRAPALHAFNRALQPFLHPGTLAHCFGVLNRQTQLKNQSYGVGRLDTLVLKPRTEEQLPHFPHPQARLSELLPEFSISRTLLLSGGQLELLLQPHQAKRQRRPESGRSRGPGSLSA